MIIGLTGGIGSGKSTVAKLLETMGCVIYNSDDRAKDLYFEAGVKKKIIELLGEEAYVTSSKLNTSFISGLVFSNAELLKQLNTIIHPAVKDDFLNFTNQYKGKHIIKESALLFETGIYKDLESMILVIAPINEKINRVMKRNSVTKADIEKRMQAQWTDEQKIPLSNFIINNGHNTALIPQVLNVLTQLPHKF